jgi:glycosyltransferase involved in cell wall biosynthesis
MSKMISVVIPALNEERMIGQCLKQFEDQPGAHEIIVVDGGSRDNTVGVVNAFPEVRLVQVSESGRGRQKMCDIINYGPYFKKNRVTLLPVLR